MQIDITSPIVIATADCANNNAAETTFDLLAAITHDDCKYSDSATCSKCIQPDTLLPQRLIAATIQMVIYFSTSYAE